MTLFDLHDLIPSRCHYMRARLRIFAGLAARGYAPVAVPGMANHALSREHRDGGRLDVDRAHHYRVQNICSPRSRELILP